MDVEEDDLGDGDDDGETDNEGDHNANAPVVLGGLKQKGERPRNGKFDIGKIVFLPSSILGYGLGWDLLL